MPNKKIVKFLQIFWIENNVLVNFLEITIQYFQIFLNLFCKNKIIM